AACPLTAPPTTAIYTLSLHDALPICPLPVLKMEKRLAGLPAGATLLVLATDPMAKVDIPLYCRQHGHSCTLSPAGEVMRFEIVEIGRATSELQSRENLVCRLLLEKKK